MRLKNVSLALAVVSTVLPLVSCDRILPTRAPVLAASEGNEEVPPRAWTVHGERLSTYVEHPEFARGDSARVLVHLTVQASGEPVRAGKVTLQLGDARHTAEAPARDGIFILELAPAATGTFALAIDVESAQATEVLALGSATVHADRATADAAARAIEHDEGDVAFLLEQQWQIGLLHEPARRVDLERRMLVPGSVRLRDGASAEVLPPVAGRLVAAKERALPRVGERVKAGEVLAYVEPPIDSATLAALHTLRLELEMRLLEANHEVEHSRLRRGFAQRELDRLLALQVDGLSTLPEIEGARREVELTVHEEEVANGQREAVERMLGERAPFDAASGSPVMRLPVLAAIDGVVVAAPHAIGTSVETSTSIVRIVDASRVWLEGRVSEFDVHKLQPQGRAFASFLALPGERRVLADAPWIAPRVSEESRTLALRFELDNADGRLREGMLADLELATDSVANALTIPNSAVVMDSGVPTAWVPVGGESFARRVLSLGLRDHERVQVVGGLAEGERVVTRGGYVVRLVALGGASMEHGHHH